MKKLFIETDGNFGGDAVYHLVDKDTPPEGYEGQSLYSHVCFGVDFALGDLIKNRPARIKEITAEYGDFEVHAAWLENPWTPEEQDMEHME